MPKRRIPTTPKKRTHSITVKQTGNTPLSRHVINLQHLSALNAITPKRGTTLARVSARSSPSLPVYNERLFETPQSSPPTNARLLRAKARAQIAHLKDTSRRAVHHLTPQISLAHCISSILFPRTFGGFVPPLTPLRLAPVRSFRPLRRIHFWNTLRTAGTFALTALVLVLPLRAAVTMGSTVTAAATLTTQGNDALSQFEAGVGALKEGRAGGANQAFRRSATLFEEMGSKLSQMRVELTALTALHPKSRRTVATATHLSEAAAALAYAAEGASALFTSNERGGRSVSGSPITEHLRVAKTHLARVQTAHLPEPERVRVKGFKTVMAALESDLVKFEALESLVRALGGTRKTRLLLVFQNNAELRATGGFIGSYAIVDIKNGAVERVQAPGGGSYDLQGALRATLVSPAPLHLINPRWEFQDANWFPDFPTSAQKLMWFLEAADGPTVDAVVAITPDVLEAVLRVMGPVDLPSYGKTLTADTVRGELQYFAELGYDTAENKPKKMIGDLLGVMLGKVEAASSAERLALAGTLVRALDRKDILVYHVRDDVRARIHAAKWDGSVRTTDHDYLMIVHSNIAGQKTDAVLHDTVTLTTTVTSDHTIHNTLEIRRTHTGTPGEPFTGVRNVDFLRVYVPQGSTLTSATGFEVPGEALFEVPLPHFSEDPTISGGEGRASIDPQNGVHIYTEGDKTVFGNWVQTDPGETTLVHLEYMLPHALTPSVRGGIQIPFFSRKSAATHSLLVQRQPGSSPAEFAHHVALPPELIAVYSTEGATTDAAFTLEQDTFIGFVVALRGEK